MSARSVVQAARHVSPKCGAGQAALPQATLEGICIRAWPHRLTPLTGPTDWPQWLALMACPNDWP